MTEKYLGRKVKEEHKFEEEGTFQSVYAAQRWLHEHGYQEGSMCGNLPIGFVKGEYKLPEKWRNYESGDSKLLAGVILSNDFREAPVTILIFELTTITMTKKDIQDLTTGYYWCRQRYQDSWQIAFFSRVTQSFRFFFNNEDCDTDWVEEIDPTPILRDKQLKP